jgi:hypothetical protein
LLPFKGIFDISYLSECEIDASSLLYICGYAVHLFCNKTVCCNCLQLAQESKGESISDDYIDELQKGGLCLPTDVVIIAFFHMASLLYYVVNSDMKEMYFQCKNQKSVLINLTYFSLEHHGFFNELEVECYSCGGTIKDIFKILCSTFSNILLNNYTKVINDVYATESSNKKRKLKTLQ